MSEFSTSFSVATSYSSTFIRSYLHPPIHLNVKQIILTISIGESYIVNKSNLIKHEICLHPTSVLYLRMFRRIRCGILINTTYKTSYNLICIPLYL